MKKSNSNGNGDSCQQLPLFVDKTQLPTKRYHISYSEIIDFVECSFRHRLKHIDKVRLEDGSIHTAFGKAVHDVINTFLLTGQMPTTDEAVSRFYHELSQLGLDTIKEETDGVQEFVDNLPDMINQVPGWLDSTFPGWEPVSAEYNLFEPIKKQKNINFKGYIDAVIKAPKKQRKGAKKKKKGEPIEYEYHILDWKTASWGWKAEQKRSFEKQLQLILYKHFFCQLMGLDLKQVKCGFVLIKRIPKKDGARIELVPVSVGPLTEAKGLKTMHNAINQIRQGRAVKNRRHCRPWCPYMMSRFCS